MLPLIADVEDLQNWSPTDISNEERAEAILAASSTLVRSYAGRAWVDADGWEDGVTALQQDQVQTVVVAVAYRVYTNPGGNTQETTGPFSRSVASWAALGLALTDEEKSMIGGGPSGIPGLTSIRVVAPAETRASRYLSTWWEDEADDDEEEGS